jgi:hypothetical protein
MPPAIYVPVENGPRPIGDWSGQGSQVRCFELAIGNVEQKNVGVVLGGIGPTNAQHALRYGQGYAVAHRAGQRTYFLPLPIGFVERVHVGVPRF